MSVNATGLLGEAYCFTPFATYFFFDEVFISAEGLNEKVAEWLDALNHHSGTVPQKCGCDVEAVQVGSIPVFLTNVTSQKFHSCNREAKPLS